MIKYSLKCVEENCNKNEPFDGWFQNSASFEKQIEAGYISCPYCGSLNIKKNIMSPSVKSTKEKIPKIISKNVKHNELNKNLNKQIDMMVILRNLKKEIQKNAEFVGKNFTKEAKAINEGKSKERAIYGQADAKDLEELKSKNIEVSLFINPSAKDVIRANELNSDAIEIHTGMFSAAIKKRNKLKIEKEFNKIKKCKIECDKTKMKFNVGHGLTYHSAKYLKKINNINEYNIGHFIIGESLFCGFSKIIKKFKKIIN